MSSEFIINEEQTPATEEEQETSSRFRRMAEAGVLAVSLGLGSPVFAESPPLVLEDIAKTSMTTSERQPLPSPEVVKSSFRASIVSAKNEQIAYFVRTKKGEEMKTVATKEGGVIGLTVTPEEIREVFEAQRTHVADIEMVHTHPLSAIMYLNLLTKDQGAEMSKQEFHGASLPPSSVDLLEMISRMGALYYPPAQFSARVIDPGGDWEYGISDSAMPFVSGIREYYETFRMEDVPLTEEDRAYIVAHHDVHLRGDLLLNELLASSDPNAISAMQKMSEYSQALLSKLLNRADREKFAELSRTVLIDPRTENGLARILYIQNIAKDLGFRLGYTPYVQSVAEK